jgi:centrosomal protein CEP290
LSEEEVKTLQNEVKNLVLESLERRQHLETLAMLFSDRNPADVTLQLTTEDKAVQVLHPETSDQETETDIVENDVIAEQKCVTKECQTQTTDENMDTEDHYSKKYLESQLKQAMALASTRSTLLLETENRLAEYQGRIKSLEKLVEEKETAFKSEREKNSGGTNETDKSSDNILSVSLISGLCHYSDAIF